MTLPCRRCKKQLSGFSIPSFKAEALKTYSAVCASLASGNVNALRQVGVRAGFKGYSLKVTVCRF